jgi:glycosyltransferase involved in cell wall biosynthesis
VPTLAILSKARGTFFKPLYEALAEAQPAPWRTLLVWPSDGANEHPSELVTPRADNLELRLVASSSRQVNATDGKVKTFLPSRETWRVLQSQDVRAVLIHEFSPFTLQGLVFAKWRRIPVVVSTEVGQANAHFFHARTRMWHGFWGRLVNGIAACCPAAHEPISGKRVPTVATYHAVDSRIYKPVAKAKVAGAPVVFAYLGQLIPRKGLDLWLDAARELRGRGRTNFVLRFIGGGDDAWLRRCIADRGLEKHCELTGFLSGAAIRESLGSADVFVLPTRQDTYAAVVHEAACLGLPLLISRHAGAAEALVQEGVNGLTIDPEDSDNFSACMEKMLQPAVRERMAGPSREIGESHSAHERGRALWHWLHDDILHAQKDVAAHPVRIRA